MSVETVNKTEKAVVESTTVKPKQKINPGNIFQSFLIGTFSGLCAEMVYYPIEKGYRPHVHPAPKSNLLHLKNYVSLRGIARDFNDMMLFRCPVTGFVLASYELMKVPMKNYFPNITPVELAYAAGATGVVIQTSIWLPYTRIHQYRLINNQKQMSYLKSGIKFVKHEGLLKLWKGYWNSYFSSCPFLVTFFAFDEIYQKLAKTINAKNHPERPLPCYYPAVAGIGASLTSIFITTPLEYLRVSVLTKKKLSSEEGKAMSKQLKNETLYKAPRFGVRKMSGPVLARGLGNMKLFPKIIQANVKGPSLKTIIQKVIFRK